MAQLLFRRKSSPTIRILSNAKCEHSSLRFFIMRYAEAYRVERRRMALRYIHRPHNCRLSETETYATIIFTMKRLRRTLFEKAGFCFFFFLFSFPRSAGAAAAALEGELSVSFSLPLPRLYAMSVPFRTGRWVALPSSYNAA